MKRLIISGITLTTFLLGMGQVRAQNTIANTLLIDDFTNLDPNSSFFFPDAQLVFIDILQGQIVDLDGNVIGIPPAINLETGLPNNNPLGGSRRSQIESVFQDNDSEIVYILDPADYTDQEGNTLAQGYVSLTNNFGADSDVTLTWNKREGNGLGELTDKFIIKVIEGDLAPSLRITVSNGISTAFLERRLPNSVNSSLLVEFPFREFVGDLNAFNGSNTTISLLLFGPPNFDAAIDYLEILQTRIVPEPSLLVGSTIALGVGMWSTRRKRKS